MNLSDLCTQTTHHIHTLTFMPIYGYGLLHKYVNQTDHVIL